MKKSKIGWSLVLTISIGALIGFGAWSLQFVKRNEAFALNSNNQGMMNLPFNREKGGKDQNYQNFGGMMGGGIYPNTFITPLPAATEGKYQTAVTTFNSIQEGDFYYICQYPSHASKGMYGKFIIK